MKLKALSINDSSENYLISNNYISFCHKCKVLEDNEIKRIILDENEDKYWSLYNLIKKIEDKYDIWNLNLGNFTFFICEINNKNEIMFIPSDKYSTRKVEESAILNLNGILNKLNFNENEWKYVEDINKKITIFSETNDEMIELLIKVIKSKKYTDLFSYYKKNIKSSNFDKFIIIFFSEDSFSFDELSIFYLDNVKITKDLIMDYFKNDKIFKKEDIEEILKSKKINFENKNKLFERIVYGHNSIEPLI